MSNPRRRHVKRLTKIVAASVALLAGVAVAFFFSSEAVSGNAARGGTLTVDTVDLPLTFGDSEPEVLYPTDPADPADGAIMEDEFSVENNNPVDAEYLITASCDNCALPDDPDATQAQKNASNQWDNLYVRITNPDNVSPTEAITADSVVYEGKLKDLVGTKLGDIAGGEAAGFNVELWLGNTDDADPSTPEADPQPQNVLSKWTLTVSARTPVPGQPFLPVP